LSRALCRFNRFDLSRLPAAKRKAALALQLPQWSPYQKSNYAVVWQNGYASVWCWDSGRIDGDFQKHGKVKKSQQKLPEPLLRAPLQTGLRLLKCLDGVEGQYWQETQLVVSRWWPQRPDQQAWLTFQRDCGIPPEQQEATSPVQELPFLLQPWAKVDSPSNSTDDLSLVETTLYSVLLLFLGFATILLGIQHFQIERAIAQRSSELASIKSRAGPVLAAREAALNSLIRLKGIVEIEPYPQPLTLMAAVADALPKDSGAFLREWDMTGNRLKIAISSPTTSIAGATYVQAFEKTGLFDDIQIVTDADPKLTSFSMTVRPIDPGERPK
jgi:hypothetical protein